MKLIRHQLKNLNIHVIPFVVQRWIIMLWVFIMVHIFPYQWICWSEEYHCRHKPQKLASHCYYESTLARGLFQYLIPHWMSLAFCRVLAGCLFECNSQMNVQDSVGSHMKHFSDTRQRISIAKYISISLFRGQLHLSIGRIKYFILHKTYDSFHLHLIECRMMTYWM